MLYRGLCHECAYFPNPESSPERYEQLRRLLHKLTAPPHLINASVSVGFILELRQYATATLRELQSQSYRPTIDTDQLEHWDEQRLEFYRWLVKYQGLTKYMRGQDRGMRPYVDFETAAGLVALLVDHTAVE